MYATAGTSVLLLEAVLLLEEGAEFITLPTVC